MKIPKQQLNEILDGMEKKLLPFTENMESIRNVSGKVLLAKGIYEAKTKGGIMHPVKADGRYVTSIMKKSPVNHRRRLKAIIEEAKDMDDMTDKLGAYQFKFGNPAFFKKAKN